MRKRKICVFNTNLHACYDDMSTYMWFLRVKFTFKNTLNKQIIHTDATTNKLTKNTTVPDCFPSYKLALKHTRQITVDIPFEPSVDCSDHNASDPDKLRRRLPWAIFRVDRPCLPITRFLTGRFLFGGSHLRRRCKVGRYSSSQGFVKVFARSWA